MKFHERRYTSTLYLPYRTVVAPQTSTKTTSAHAHPTFSRVLSNNGNQSPTSADYGNSKHHFRVDKSADSGPLWQRAAIVSPRDTCRTVNLKLTLTLVVTLTDTGGAVLTLMLGYRSLYITYGNSDFCDSGPLRSPVATS